MPKNAQDAAALLAQLDQYEAQIPGAQSGDTGTPWGEVGSQALSNVGASAGQYGKDILHAVLNPIDTVANVGKTVIGGIQKLIPTNPHSPHASGSMNYEPYAEAVGDFFADRYGGLEETKQTLATDPVGFAGDLATVLSGGAGMAAKAPSVSKALAKGARAVDPATALAKALGTVGNKAVGPVSAQVLGLIGGSKPESVRRSMSTGLAGGDRGKVFRGHMRGEIPAEDVVRQAREGIQGLRQQRGSDYRTAMQSVKSDNSVLSMKGIDDALRDTLDIKRFKGVDLSPSTAGIRQQMMEAVDQWKMLDPSEYHTAIGMDALKQQLGDIRQSTQFGTPERRLADQVYNSVKKEIVKQAPEYKTTMDKYATQTAELDDIERSLSLGERAAPETAVRKLQAIVRDDVSSAYGMRAEKAKRLEEAGADHLFDAVAGMSMQSYLPRGLQSAVAPIGVGGAAYANPALALPLALAASPRIVGEVSHALGRGARKAQPLARSLATASPWMYQAGRTGQMGPQ